MKRAIPTKPIQRRTPLKRSEKRIAPRRSKPRRTSGLKCPDYVTWLHTRPCAVCQDRSKNSDGAHCETNGMGSKAGDDKRLPLCRKCHMEQHRIGIPRFEEIYSIDMKLEAAAHWQVYRISQGEITW